MRKKKGFTIVERAIIAVQTFEAVQKKHLVFVRLQAHLPTFLWQILY